MASSPTPLLKKIELITPIVDIDGDDMARVLHHYVRRKLLSPFISFNHKVVYIDCCVERRLATQDKVLADAIAAVNKYGVAVKCATHTPTWNELTQAPVSLLAVSSSPRASVSGPSASAPNSEALPLADTSLGEAESSIYPIHVEPISTQPSHEGPVSGNPESDGDPGPGWKWMGRLKSANNAIRNAIGGTVFREPIVIPTVPRLLGAWKSPIIVARCGRGENSTTTEMIIKSTTSTGAESSSMKFSVNFSPVSGANSQSKTYDVFEFNAKDGKIPEVLMSDEEDRECESLEGSFCSSAVAGGALTCADVLQRKSSILGVALVSVNSVEWIRQFARSVFHRAVERKMPVYFSADTTSLPHYDRLYVSTFQEIYTEEFRGSFEKLGIKYHYKPIQQMMASCLRSDGGFIWACKNQDGAWISNFVAQGFGSVALMTSVLISPDGSKLVSSTCHGTIPRHYHLHVTGRSTSTNPVASIFAWTLALRQRGLLDKNEPLVKFTADVEKATVHTIEQCIMTRDLGFSLDALEYTVRQSFTRKEYVPTKRFVDVVLANLKKIRELYTTSATMTSTTTTTTIGSAAESASSPNPATTLST